jgi:oligopeptide transport system substrate-binding protein
MRKGATWSNGEPVIAQDFVISWKRLAALGDKTAHRDLIRNIVGFDGVNADTNEAAPRVSSPEHPLSQATQQTTGNDADNERTGIRVHEQPVSLNADVKTDGESNTQAKKAGVEAVGDLTLKVTLIDPDKDFPKLVANPIFRPIYGDGTEFQDDPLDSDVVTNGAFTVDEVDREGITLVRSDTYWNRSAVALERVRFVAAESAEAALELYKNGEVDAVTNADFEPLALKLLEPYQDFRQTTHSAINLYEINTKNAPFNDRRVREALASAIDRDRLANVELGGSTLPATTFLPVGHVHASEILYDATKARDLLTKAGYPNGENFPQIRLVINRNDTQQRVARAVAHMWKQDLNVDTQIIVKEVSETESTRARGDFDMIRRGLVLPTLDEMVSLRMIFGAPVSGESAQRDAHTRIPDTATDLTTELKAPTQKHGPPNSGALLENTENAQEKNSVIKSEDDAILEIDAIPLYFPVSYTLVKPYVRGFDLNVLDAPSLKDVSIDSDWQLRSARREL